MRRSLRYGTSTYLGVQISGVERTGARSGLAVKPADPARERAASAEHVLKVSAFY